MNQSLKLSEDQRDGLQEVVNVAMGRAGDSLARFLEVFIHLSVPNIHLVDADALYDALAKLIDNNGKPVSAVRQGFFSTKDSAQGLRGEAIVIFSEASFQELAELLAYEDDHRNDKAEKELLLDITNILNGVCLTGISDQLHAELSFSAPSVLGHHIPLKEVLPQDGVAWHQALLIEINYTLEKGSFKCNLLLLMPGDAIEVVKGALDDLLGDEC